MSLNAYNQLILLVKDEFIDVAGEERCLTESWQLAEREATAAHRRGGLPSYDAVDEMVDSILDDHIYPRNTDGHQILS